MAQCDGQGHRRQQLKPGRHKAQGAWHSGYQVLPISLGVLPVSRQVLLH